MDFKVIDEMGPFLLIENDDDNCGLIDAEGNLCIPCEMGCVMDHGGEDYYLFAACSLSSFEEEFLWKNRSFTRTIMRRLAWLRKFLKP